MIKIIMIIILVVVLVNYNKLVKGRNSIKNAKSAIDVYLNQRFDLIPNLVECVKGYASHEKEVFEEITSLRATYNNDKSIKEAEKLNNKMNQVIAVAENYPELKASEHFLNLQRNLTKIESQLQAARRIYNMEVTSYNNKVETIPTNIIASIFGFKEEELFQIEEYKKENIKIEFHENKNEESE